MNNFLKIRTIQKKKKNENENIRNMYFMYACTNKFYFESINLAIGTHDKNNTIKKKKKKESSRCATIRVCKHVQIHKCLRN